MASPALKPPAGGVLLEALVAAALLGLTAAAWVQASGAWWAFQRHSAAQAKALDGLAACVPPWQGQRATPQSQPTSGCEAGVDANLGARWGGSFRPESPGRAPEAGPWVMWLEWPDPVTGVTQRLRLDGYHAEVARLY